MYIRSNGMTDANRLLRIRKMRNWTGWLTSQSYSYNGKNWNIGSRERLSRWICWNLKRLNLSRSLPSWLLLAKSDCTVMAERKYQKESEYHTWYLAGFPPFIALQRTDLFFPAGFWNHLRQCKYSVNTIAKHMKHLRTLTNEAIRQGYLSHNDYPFRNYRIKTETKTHKFLLPSELQLLENLTIADKYPELKHILDAFLFCCYTGLRYSDFTSLSTENFITLNEKLWLVFHSQKQESESPSRFICSSTERQSAS